MVEIYKGRYVFMCGYSYYQYDALTCEWIKISASVFNTEVFKSRSFYVKFFATCYIEIYLFNGFPAYKRVYSKI